MIKTGLTEEELERSALLLNGLLADHFTLMLKTWQFHWNVVGDSFGCYHEAMLKLSNYSFFITSRTTFVFLLRRVSA